MIDKVKELLFKLKEKAVSEPGLVIVGAVVVIFVGALIGHII